MPCVLRIDTDVGHAVGALNLAKVDQIFTDVKVLDGVNAAVVAIEDERVRIRSSVTFQIVIAFAADQVVIAVATFDKIIAAFGSKHVVPGFGPDPIAAFCARQLIRCEGIFDHQTACFPVTRDCRQLRGNFRANY